MDIPQSWISTGEAARCIGIAAPNVLRLINLGKLRAVRTRLGYLIDPDSVDAYKREREERERKRAERESVSDTQADRNALAYPTM